MSKIDIKNKNNHNNSNLVSSTPKSTNRPCKFLMFNAQSICNKTTEINDFIIDEKPDFVLISETWLNENNSFMGDQITPTGYVMTEVSRPDKRGGGTAIISKSAYNPTIKQTTSFQTFETICNDIKLPNDILRVACVYRPPSAPNKQFYDEITVFLEEISLDNCVLVIAGDFNVHMDKKNDPFASKFSDILDDFNLVQHVQTHTHKSGHCLDLVITKKRQTFRTCSIYRSDHFSVIFHVDVNKLKFGTKRILTRNLKDIAIPILKQDIKLEMAKLNSNTTDINAFVAEFNQGLRNALDKHAPVKTKQVSLRPFSPWFSGDILREKRNRRAIERSLRTKYTIERLKQYKECKNRLNRLIKNAKKDYYENAITVDNRNPKALFKLFNKLVGERQSTQYPKAESNKQLANDFVQFFKDKIEKIVAQFDTGTDTASNSDKPTTTPKLLEFKELSQEEIERYILKSPSTTCELDPLPTDLLKCCLDELLPAITYLVNQSLSTGTMPSIFKQALVIPLLKKPNATIEPENFRPMSNLSFLSKVIERIVIDQMSAHCQHHNLNEKLQSAYRRHHSTETALLKVTDDILRSFDRQEVTIMALLDLSAAFDTVDHSIYIDRLGSEYGIEGTPQKWMSSYLSQRSQQVAVNSERSEKFELSTRFPQGGRAGPWAYSRYTQPISRVIQLFSILYHFFADDTQLYKHFSTSTIQAQTFAKSALELCIKGVSQWMYSNRLKLNMSKTECIVFGTKRQISKLKFETITVCNETITSVPNVRNLGVHLDQELKMKAHVSAITKSAYFHIRKLYSVRKY